LIVGPFMISLLRVHAEAPAASCLDEVSLVVVEIGGGVAY